MPTTTTTDAAQRRLRQVKRANFRMIEAELYDYPRSKQMLIDCLKELRVIADSTITTMPADEVRVQSGSGFSDIVASRAGELAEQRYYTAMVLQETARRLDAIAWMLGRLGQDPEPKKRRLVEMRYFECKLTDEGIQAELHISAATFWRWRREAVRWVADRLGLIV